MLMYDIEIFKRRPRFKNCVDCVCLCHYRNRGPQSDRDVRTKGQSCRRRAIAIEPPARSYGNFSSGTHVLFGQKFYIVHPMFN